MSAEATSDQLTGAATRPPAGSFKRQLRLLGYARPHWRGVTVMLAAMGLEIVLNLARPWPLKVLVDNVLGTQAVPGSLAWLPNTGTDHGLLVWVVVTEVAIFLVGTFASMASDFTSLRLGQQMTFALAGDLFRHVQRLSLRFHSRRSVGDLIARVLDDSYCADTFLTGALLPALQALVTLILMFVVMFQLQAGLTLMALIVVPFIIVAVRLFGRPMKDRSREQRDSEGRLFSVVEQTLNAMPAVQAFTREDVEQERFRRQANRTLSAYVRATFAGMWFQLFTGLATTLGTAAIIYVGARLALDGKLTTGTIIVFVYYLGSLYAPVDSLSHTTQTVQSVAAETDRVMEVLEIEPDVVDRPQARPARVEGAVRYDSVTFGYDPGRPVLHSVSLEAQPGETVAIVGPTGAGKTTLVSLLVRFFDPWEGAVTIGGTDIRDFRVRSLREQIAMVLQDPFIFPFTIAENIDYADRDTPREKIVEAAKAANAHDFITRLPDGYDTVIGERGATLSGGEKQRLSIARAFLKDAPILILDEPTSALDARTEGALLDALERLMAGRITFVIAHRLSTIRGADRILVVDDGRIIEQGTHGDLLASGGLYARLYRQQMEIAEHAIREP